MVSGMPYTGRRPCFSYYDRICIKKPEKFKRRVLQAKGKEENNGQRADRRREKGFYWKKILI